MDRIASWSLSYWFVKQYVIFTHWLVHRKIIVTGRENLPQSKPVILAPNHQNALLDPLAVLCNCRYQPVWLARADIFQITAAVPALRFLKIMPIYRIRDGAENLAKNEIIFERSINVLRQKGVLALFPEGTHTFKRQILPHKKAVPRIAFMAADKIGFDSDIQIVPVGIFYSHYWKFGRKQIVRFGKPIPLADFENSYKENQASANIMLRDRIHNDTMPLIMNFNSKPHYDGMEAVREICSNALLEKKRLKKNVWNQYVSDCEMVDRINFFTKENPEEATALGNKALSFLEKVKSEKLRAWLIDRKEEKASKIVLNTLFLIITLPFFAAGFIINVLPFFLSDFITRKAVKDIAFHGSVFYVAGLVLFPLFYLIEILIAWLVFHAGWYVVLALIAAPFIGKFAFMWYIGFRKTWGRIKWLYMKKFRKNDYEELSRIKSEICDIAVNLTSALP